MVRLADPLTQIIVLGLICFCCPGMFNALQGTGTYGLDPKDTDVGNRAGTSLSLVFAASSLFAGALFNILGHRVLLLLGGLTYVLYVGSFLAYSAIKSIVFVVISSCLLGVGAGWLWCAQGAIMMGYPEEGEKGKYFSIFWTIFNLGGVLGNVIPLGIQWNDGKSGASNGSYIGYMVVMTLGSFMTLLLLPISKVHRKDGSPVVKIKYSNPILELKSVFALFKDWRMLALIPMFFTSNWVYTYQFTGFNAPNFTGRTRSMNSMFYWLAQIFASIIYGAFLDRAQWTRQTRARYGLILLAAACAATWVGGIVFQRTFGPQSAIFDDVEAKDWVKNPKDYHNIDLVKNTSEYLGPFFLYFFYGVVDSMYQGYSYWLMGALTNDTNQAARFAGFYKFIQNLGGVLAPVVQTSVIGNAPSQGANIQNASTRGMGEIIICVVLVFIGVIGAIPVAWKAVQNTTIEEDDGEKQETFEEVKA